MNRMGMRTSALVLLIAFGLHGQCQAGEDWSEHPEWSGGWKLTPEIAELLGFAKSDDPLPDLGSLQIGFFVSQDVAVDVLGDEAVRLVQERVQKLGHTIVAAGRFRDSKDDDRGSMCFVTEKGGATFLWFGDQSDSFSFAKVHFLRGATPAHDVLILDFGGVFKQRLPGGKGAALKAIGYRRPLDD